MPETASPRGHEFEVDCEAVYRYARLRYSLVALVAGAALFGVGVVLGPVWYLLIGPWLHRRQVEALRYRLEGRTLRIDSGFIFISRKSIPLDRVTDVVLVQGPLMRRYGIWALRIQTAGAGQQMPEGVMIGIPDAEAARDFLMRRRDEVAGANRSGT